MNIIHRDGHRIVTEYIYPPIPVRTMDWQATLDNYDCDWNAQAGYFSTCPMGWGETEAAAIADLLEAIE
jgi:hypothetical protein